MKWTSQNDTTMALVPQTARITLGDTHQSSVFIGHQAQPRALSMGIKPMKSFPSTHTTGCCAGVHQTVHTPTSNRHQDAHRIDAVDNIIENRRKEMMKPTPRWHRHHLTVTMSATSHDAVSNIKLAEFAHQTRHCLWDTRSDDHQCRGSSSTSRKAWNHIDKSDHNRPTTDSLIVAMFPLTWLLITGYNSQVWQLIYLLTHELLQLAIFLNSFPTGLPIYWLHPHQCFDTAGWATGRASSL